MSAETTYDVIVIGGGHAGCEAAHAATRMGCQTALLTLNPERIGFMSCNPAMGGLAKGQLIKEIDALGGVMGRITDQTAIQYRRLNASKGPAVRSSRAQCDKALYAEKMQEFLKKISGLTVLKAEASGLLVHQNRVVGVRFSDGAELRAKAVIITSGTFLRAVMFTGEDQMQGGRVGDPAAMGLSRDLEGLGFRLARLKTGTPPRLNRKTVDFSKCEEQPGDKFPLPFSFYQELSPFPYLPQISCYITYTNDQTHEIIDKNIYRSPMYSGLIRGVGPRYCPSIEDKVKRFRDKDRHQIFLEPEGLTTDEIYVNGVSTSLPKEVQVDFIRSIRGLERAEFIRFGYAVEYDAIDARLLKHTLESKDISGLFCAGQINGTSGYEEAGAQGLLAGINAARSVFENEPFILNRDEAYAGVMVDDLTTRGVDEPYRMFTSRAEYRLLLREDNADLRLSDKSRALGLLGEEDYDRFCKKREKLSQTLETLRTTYLYPTEETNQRLDSLSLGTIKDRVSLETLLKRPEVRFSTLMQLGLETSDAFGAPLIEEQAEIQIKYEGYIQRDRDLMEGVRKHETLKIPLEIDFNQVSGLSNEIRGRLEQARPETLGQAARMAGMTPAAIANLLIHLKIQERPRSVV